MREQSAWKKRIALKAAFDQIDALSGSDQTDNDEVIAIAANKSFFHLNLSFPNSLWERHLRTRLWYGIKFRLRV